MLGKFFSHYLKKRGFIFIVYRFTKKLKFRIRTGLKGFAKAKLRILNIYYQRKIIFVPLEVKNTVESNIKQKKMWCLTAASAVWVRKVSVQIRSF